MNWVDLLTIVVAIPVGWVGARLGATRLSAVAALPASLGAAYGIYRWAALVVQPLTGLSMRTSQPVAFALVLLLSLGAFHQLAKRGSLNAQTKLDRSAGCALGVWSSLVACALGALFVSNYPAGWMVLSSSWVWRLLSAARMV